MPHGQSQSADKFAKALAQPGHLSQCVSDFLDVVADPFGEPAKACAPGQPCYPSQKIKCWGKGTFANSSANGGGFVIFDPAILIANDSDPISTTGATFAGTTFALTGTGISVSNSNSPLTSAQITGDPSSGAAVRLVAAGLRIRCRSNAMTRDGDAVGMVTPNHDTLVGRSLTDMLAFSGVSREKNSEDWIAVKMSPSFPHEFVFDDETNEFEPCIGFWVQGTAGQTWDYECVGHYEAIGKTVETAVTPSASDPVGGPVAVEMLTNAPQLVNHPLVTSAHLKTAVLSRVARQVTRPTDGQLARSLAMGRNRRPEGQVARIAKHVAATAAEHVFKDHGRNLADHINSQSGTGFGDLLHSLVSGLLPGGRGEEWL